MEYRVSLAKRLFVHLVCLQVMSAESGMRPRAEWQWGGEDVVWTVNTRQPQVTSRRWRRVSVPPGDRPEHSSESDAGPIDRIDHGFGGFSTRGFSTRGFSSGRKVADRSRAGRFNSDTHGCNGIQTRSCSANLHCTGCLGLYTCNLSLGRCKLKGLSQRTGKFLQALQNI